MQLPLDKNILLSLINTMLRDKYSSLAALCDDNGFSEQVICERLAAIDYVYDEKLNRFV